MRDQATPIDVNHFGSPLPRAPAPESAPVILPPSAKMHNPEPAPEQDLYQALGVARNAGDKEVRARAAGAPVPRRDPR